MRHALLRDHVQKGMLFERNLYRKGVEQTCLISW